MLLVLLMVWENWKHFVCDAFLPFTTHKTDRARQTGREAQTQPTRVNPALSDDVRNKIGSVWLHKSADAMQTTLKLPQVRCKSQNTSAQVGKCTAFDYLASTKIRFMINRLASLATEFRPMMSIVSWHYRLSKHDISLAKLPYEKCFGLKQKYIDNSPTVQFLGGV